MEKGSAFVSGGERRLRTGGDPVARAHPLDDAGRRRRVFSDPVPDRRNGAKMAPADPGGGGCTGDHCGGAGLRSCL